MKKTIACILTTTIILVVVIEAFPNQRVGVKEYSTTRSECNCACGANNRQNRIVGGNVTKPNEFPWMAGLFRNGEFYCGASLITRRHLLTAAHCVNGFDARGISVILADHDRTDTKRFAHLVTRQIKRVVQHRAFDASTYNNDIAVIEMDAPINFNEHIQPVCLPVNGGFDYAGRFGVVAGWGRLGERQPTSTVLRKVVVPVWSKEECYQSGYGEERLSENMFCAGYQEGQKDACQGDSGGPLHMKNVLGDMEIIGVVSWGRGCGRAKLPGIYTKVTNYIDWVEEALKGECLCQPQNPRRA